MSLAGTVAGLFRRDRDTGAEPPPTAAEILAFLDEVKGTAEIGDGRVAELRAKVTRAFEAQSAINLEPWERDHAVLTTAELFFRELRLRDQRRAAEATEAVAAKLLKEGDRRRQQRADDWKALSPFERALLLVAEEAGSRTEIGRLFLRLGELVRNDTANMRPPQNTFQPERD